MGPKHLSDVKKKHPYLITDNFAQSTDTCIRTDEDEEKFCCGDDRGKLGKVKVCMGLSELSEPPSLKL